MSEVFLYGATGFTGRLIAEVLQRRELSFTVAGRDRLRLEAMSSALESKPTPHAVQVHDETALRDAIRGHRVVVNCAGPFGQLGEPVVRAAIECGAHYLDTTGEQAFLRNIYERCESLARKAEVAVVNSLAFEIAIGDWAASLAARALGEGPLDEVSVGYALEGFRTTGGTQASILHALSEEGCVWNDERWEPVAPAAETRLIPFPAPFGRREALSFPSGEVITVPRHIDTKRVVTFLSLAEDTPAMRLVNRATSLFGAVLPALVSSPLGAIARSQVASQQRAPSDTQRETSLFAVVARAERSFERKQAMVSGTDPYGVTAEIIGFAAQKLVREETTKFGVLAPTELFDPESSLQSIAELANLRVEYQ